MPRCIVLIRSHEPLQEGWRKRSFGPAGSLLDDRVKVAGVRFDETYHPVQVWRRIGGGDDPPAASGFDYRASDRRPPTPCVWTQTTRTPSSACGATAAPTLSGCSPTPPYSRSPPPTAATHPLVPRRTWPGDSASPRCTGPS